MKDYQIRSKVHPKSKVRITVKRNGKYNPELVEGVVQDVLTKTSEHYRGIKVRLTDGTIGRVKEIIH